MGQAAEARYSADDPPFAVTLLVQTCRSNIRSFVCYHQMTRHPTHILDCLSNSWHWRAVWLTLALFAATPSRIY